jgi:hypothetical protein
MGWRPGRGIATAAAAATAASGRRKWGTVAGVSLDNTPLYVLEPKVRTRFQSSHLHRRHNHHRIIIAVVFITNFYLWPGAWQREQYACKYACVRDMTAQ